MSPEQSATPISEQLAAYLESNANKGYEYDEGKSDLTPIEVIRARQAIAAAIHTAPSGSLELQKVEVEKKTLAPNQMIHWYGKATINLRMERQHDFDLTKDDELNPDMFNSPAQQLKSTDTQDNYGKVA